METQRGKQREQLDRQSLATSVATHACCQVDLGTGDGRCVRSSARAHPERLVIGVDACREQLYGASRRALPNELYVIANAEELPTELAGVASLVTINFPWGSLLEGLLRPNSAVMAQVVALVRPGASLEVRLNSGALAEAGYTLAAGASQARAVLHGAGFALAAPIDLDATALRACPTTWAKRLAFGRDPRATLIMGRWLPSVEREQTGAFATKWARSG